MDAPSGQYRRMMPACRCRYRLQASRASSARIMDTSFVVRVAVLSSSASAIGLDTPIELAVWFGIEKDIRLLDETVKNVPRRRT